MALKCRGDSASFKATIAAQERLLSPFHARCSRPQMFTGHEFHENVDFCPVEARHFRLNGSPCRSQEVLQTETLNWRCRGNFFFPQIPCAVNFCGRLYIKLMSGDIEDQMQLLLYARMSCWDPSQVSILHLGRQDSNFKTAMLKLAR